MPTLNRNQKLILIALVAGVAFMQFLLFEEDGVRGYGWILSFVVIAGVLLLLFKKEVTPDAVSLPTAPPSDTGTLNDLTFELGQIYRQAISVPIAEDITTKLVQRDMIFGSIEMLAYGLLAIKRAKSTSGYLSQPEHSELIALVVKRLVSSRTKITGGMAVGISIPGLEQSPDFKAIKEAVLHELQAILTAIAIGNTLRSKSEAESRLLQHFVRTAPYATSEESREALRKAMSAFTSGYLR